MKMEKRKEWLEEIRKRDSFSHSLKHACDCFCLYISFSFLIFSPLHKVRDEWGTDFRVLILMRVWIRAKVSQIMDIKVFNIRV